MCFKCRIRTRSDRLQKGKKTKTRRGSTSRGSWYQWRDLQLGKWKDDPVVQEGCYQCRYQNGRYQEGRYQNKCHRPSWPLTKSWHPNKRLLMSQNEPQSRCPWMALRRMNIQNGQRKWQRREGFPASVQKNAKENNCVAVKTSRGGTKERKEEKRGREIQNDKNRLVKKRRLRTHNI